MSNEKIAVIESEDLFGLIDLQSNMISIGNDQLHSCYSSLNESNKELDLYKYANSTEGNSSLVVEIKRLEGERDDCFKDENKITLDDCAIEINIQSNALNQFLQTDNNQDWCHSYSSSATYTSVLCSVDYLGKQFDAVSGGRFWQDTPSNVKFYTSGVLTVAVVVAIGGLGFAGYTSLFSVVAEDLTKQVEMLTDIATDYNGQISDLAGDLQVAQAATATANAALNVANAALVMPAVNIAYEEYQAAATILQDAAPKGMVTALAAIAQRFGDPQAVVDYAVGMNAGNPQTLVIEFLTNQDVHDYIMHGVADPAGFLGLVQGVPLH